MYLVADSDRERGLALLRRHYADGRLSVEELADRVESLTRARTTAELRRALRDLPHATTTGELLPRLVALRDSPAGAAVSQRLVRVGVAIVLVACWLSLSVVLLATLAVTMVVAGASAAVAASFSLVWAAITWLAWRIWRRGPRRGPHHAR